MAIVKIPGQLAPNGLFPVIDGNDIKGGFYIVDTIEERNNIYTEHSYIFVSQQKQNLGKPLTYRGAYEVFNTVKRKTGIRLNFHDLRHTYATSLIESGFDSSVVQIILGHEHLTTTQKYTHISNQYLEDSLSRYWNKSSLIGGGANGK